MELPEFSKLSFISCRSFFKTFQQNIKQEIEGAKEELKKRK